MSRVWVPPEALAESPQAPAPNGAQPAPSIAWGVSELQDQPPPEAAGLPGSSNPRWPAAEGNGVRTQRAQKRSAAQASFVDFQPEAGSAQ
eukprot:1804251-Alexandrium_andersonii.AAC.1